MKKNIVRKQSIIFMLAPATASMLTGCQKSGETRRESSNPSTFTSATMGAGRDNSTDNAGTRAEEAGEELTGTLALEVRFGDGGAPLIMQMEDNTTADAIAGRVGAASWRLPAYYHDDYENWEITQYYDTPNHYEIPSEPEMVTAEKVGEVHYSESSHIILFYQDEGAAEEYTKIGTVEDTGGFREAVEDNPILEGWDNKVVLIGSLVNLF